MNDKHPITPPTELVEQWYETADNVSEDVIIGVANRAAQWGADQELEACYTEVTFWGSKGMADRLQATRRPKPPSLKEVALEDLRSIELLQKEHKMVACTFNIRQALEALPE